LKPGARDGDVYTDPKDVLVAALGIGPYRSMADSSSGLLNTPHRHGVMLTG
jgi:hypothetical protein